MDEKEEIKHNCVSWYLKSNGKIKSSFHSTYYALILLVITDLTEKKTINTKYKNVDWAKCILLTNNTQIYILKNGNIHLMIITLIIEIKKILNDKYHNINILEEYLNYKV